MNLTSMILPTSLCHNTRTCRSSSSENMLQPSEISTEATVIIHSIMIVLCIIGIVVNSMIVILFMRYKTLRHKEGLFFMTLLAFCDAISCTTNLANGSYRLFHKFHPLFLTVTECIPLISTSGSPLIMCQLANVALALDRLFAVHSPLSYRKSNHELHVKVASAIIIIVTVVTAVTPYHNVDMTLYPSSCRVGAIAGLPFLIYWMVLVNAIAIITIALCIALVVTAHRAVKQNQLLDSNSRRAAQQQAGITQAVVTITVIFTCTWVAPNFMSTVVFVTNPALSPHLTMVNLTLALLSVFNSCINFFIYSQRHPNFRFYLRRMWLSVKRERNPSALSLNVSKKSFPHSYNQSSIDKPLRRSISHLDKTQVMNSRNQAAKSLLVAGRSLDVGNANTDF